MKPISSLFCAILLGTTALAAMPVVSQAAGIGPGEDALSVGVGIGVLIGQQDDDRRHRRDNGDQQDDRDRRDNGGNDRRGGHDRGGGQHDDGIGRAMDIGRNYGRVLNAWPQGGSLFLVRVDTPHGRVDMVIDVDSGRVVGER